MSKEPSNKSSSQRTEEFMALYSAHHQRIYLYIVSLVISLDDAEDLLSEASLVLWKKFDDFQLDTNFFAWACQIVRNLVLQQAHRQTRAGLLLDMAVLEKLAIEAATDENPRDRDLREALAVCLEKCPPSDRQLIEKRYLAGSTVKSLAMLLGRSPNALSKSLSRIRSNLMECIDRTMAVSQRGSEGNR